MRTKDLMMMMLAVAGVALVVAAIFYAFGRRDERLVALEARLASAEGDVRELKQEKLVQDVKRGLLKQAWDKVLSITPWGK